MSAQIDQSNMSGLNSKPFSYVYINSFLFQHFLSYLNCLRVKEYCTAVHNSFHYFDRKTGVSVDPDPNPPSQNKQKEEEVHRRYAALNLAALHYRFGHKYDIIACLLFVIISFIYDSI